MASPLTLPETPAGVARVKLEIERVDFSAPEASGKQGGVQAGWPLWLGTWELDRVDRVSGDLWNAFQDRLRGRQRLFLAGDTSRPYPAAYPNGFAGMNRAGGGAFTGAALSWAQNIDTDGNAEIALTGLPAGLVLAVGDYIGFKWDAAGAAAGTYHRRALVRIVTPGTASAGGAVTVEAEPPINTLVVPAGAVAHLDRPMAAFKQDPEKSSLGPRGGGSSMAGGSFVAIQDLRP